MSIFQKTSGTFVLKQSDVWQYVFNIACNVLNSSAAETSAIKIPVLYNQQHLALPAQHREDASCKLTLFPDVVSSFPRKELSRKSQSI